jgi:hypothetical protein
MMLPVAQTKACREEVVKTSPTIKLTISSQDIFPSPEQFSPLHGTALYDTCGATETFFSASL